jgi:hypothetical protein
VNAVVLPNSRARLALTTPGESDENWANVVEPVQNRKTIPEKSFTAKDLIMQLQWTIGVERH